MKATHLLVLVLFVFFATSCCDKPYEKSFPYSFTIKMNGRYLIREGSQIEILKLENRGIRQDFSQGYFNVADSAWGIIFYPDVKGSNTSLLVVNKQLKREDTLVLNYEFRKCTFHYLKSTLNGSEPAFSKDGVFVFEVK